jgi:type IV pilus assembly protein PilA
MSDRMRDQAARSRRAMTRGLGDEPGFTLVELLIVMLVLALLAAIAMPSFYGQRDKARDAEAKQTLTTAQLAAETYALDNDGSFSGVTVADLAQIEQTLNGTPLTVLAAGPRTYKLEVVSGSNSVFSLERTAAGTERSCDPPGAGGCEAVGTW